jgi:hypothetical protein
MTTLTVDTPATSIDSDIAGTTAGIVFAVPYSKQGIAFAYQLVYTGSPSAVSVAFQISIDNSNWVTIDTSTNKDGELVNLAKVVARFVRLYHTSRTGGTKVTGTIFMGGI